MDEPLRVHISFISLDMDTQDSMVLLQTFGKYLNLQVVHVIVRDVNMDQAFVKSETITPLLGTGELKFLLLLLVTEELTWANWVETDVQYLYVVVLG